MIVWLQFIACTVVIVYAGTKLSKYGDIIAEKTGMGRTWIGVVLLASVTSLPELMTGVSSIAVFDLPDIAVGDVLGSCMFNILIIALLDLSRAQPVSSRTHQGQVLTAGYGILLLGIVSFAIVANGVIPTVGWIGLYSVVFLLIYLGAMRMVFMYEKRRTLELAHEDSGDAQYEHISKRRAYSMYAVHALLIVAAATWLPHVGDQISEMTGLGKTFVGSIFIAFSTSLPELVISFGAYRIGAIDLMFGNLFGSNLFNIGILAIDDILYVKGALLSDISQGHLIASNAAIIMTAIAVIGLTYQTKKKLLYLAWDSVSIIAVYLAAIAILFSLG